MDRYWKVFALFVLLSLCGCVHHVPAKMHPSMVPEKRLTKTAAPPASVLKEESDAGPDPWKTCSAAVDTGCSLLKTADLQPEEFRRRVQITFMIQENELPLSFILKRCMGGRVYACLVNETNSCIEKLDLSIDPNDQMRTVCADEQMEGGILSPLISGRNSIYEWRCHDGKPVITGQVTEADAAGYDKSLWFEIPVPAAGLN